MTKKCIFYTGQSRPDPLRPQPCTCRLCHRFFTGSLRHFDVLGSLERLTLIRPHRRELLVNVFSSLLPLVNLRQPLSDLLQLLLHLQLLPLSADALKLPAIAAVTLSQDKVVGVVLLQRSAGRDGN